MSDNPEVSRPSLLLIGGTRTGKTHFGGQLLRRLQQENGELRMVGTPSDLTVFKEVCACLSEGRSAPHTPTAVYRESLWQVRSVTSPLETDLIWPDYAGEQIGRIVSSRRVPDAWVKRIRDADGWLLFIRLSAVRKPEDVLSRPRTRERMEAAIGASSPDAEELAVDGNAQEPDSDPSQSQPQAGATPTVACNLLDQARLLELLQSLLFAKQVSLQSPVRSPALMVVLSCWDELGAPDKTKPADLLAEKLPLLAQFIKANWAEGSADVIGLSALGKRLLEDTPDEGYINNGPERHGWCVLPDGEVSSDLTLPVVMLMQKLATA